MHPDHSSGIEITAPYWEKKEIVSHARYDWNCWDRGNEPFVILQWTLSGEGAFEYQGRSIPVPVDHAFIAIVPERSRYYYPPEAREPWTFSWINFYGPLVCDLFLRLRKEFGSVIPLSTRGAAAAALRRLMNRGDVSKSADRIQISLQAYNFVLEWWREASRPAGRPKDRLASAIRFSRDHFREPLNVKQLAAEAGMTREHFSRIFAEHTGETPAMLLRRLRTEEATHLIRETDLPLREIAMRSGFYSERHLMRTFQRLQRVNPSTLRRGKKGVRGTE